MLFYTNMHFGGGSGSETTHTCTRCFPSLRTVIWIGGIMIMMDLLI